MLALTLWRPVALWVALGVKRIENRPWAPPAELLDATIAIHAGRAWSEEWNRKSLELLAGQTINGVSPEHFKHVEGIIGTVRIIGWCDASGVRIRSWERLGLCVSDRAWLTGPIGWVLRDAKLFREPIPARGFQKLWHLTPDQHRRVLEAQAA